MESEFDFECERDLECERDIECDDLELDFECERFDLDLECERFDLERDFECDFLCLYFLLQHLDLHIALFLIFTLGLSMHKFIIGCNSNVIGTSETSHLCEQFFLFFFIVIFIKNIKKINFVRIMFK